MRTLSNRSLVFFAVVLFVGCNGGSDPDSKTGDSPSDGAG
jgi:hypothetical protein